MAENATVLIIAARHFLFDFDWLVIGSGFGGSESALRLSEKGYSVGVLECGRRFSRLAASPRASRR